MLYMVAAPSLRELENIVAAQSKKSRTEAAILGSVALAGVLVVAVLAPNAVQVLRHLVPSTTFQNHGQSVRRAISRLIRNKLIEKKAGKYTLTAAGRERFEKLTTVREMRSAFRDKNEKEKWDGKWRIVIFDIKESRRAKRDELRSLLIRTGFIKLQESVWVFPYRCDEVIALLKFHLTLGWDLVYIIADAIEGDDRLRRHFSLPAYTP